jgi:large subunit ribosomal protein L35
MRMKHKTHRGAAKRYRKTGTGKFKRASANKSHILTKKSPKRKRHLRKGSVVSKVEVPKIRKMLPHA